MIEAPVATAQLVAAPSEELLRRIQGPGPRYTSYPTADRFGEGFGAGDLVAALDARRAASDAGVCEPLSLHVHVPFSESACGCGPCNQVVTRHHERAAPCVDALELEMALVTDQLGACRAVSRLHLGGASPTFLPAAELARLMGAIRRSFFLTPEADVSIEIDPPTVDAGRLRHLRGLGFDRLSLGVQDFDPDVQRAVHRELPFEQVHALMAAARGIGFGSVDVDLVYGLPRQTPRTFERTLAQVVQLRPDRILLHAYAPPPGRSRPQRRMPANELPDGPQRVAMLGHAMAAFCDQGYECTGMDHFALPGDAAATREGRPHRHGEGGGTRPDGDLVGLGVSSVGRIGDSCYQNEATLDRYYAALEADRLPVARGLRLDADDRVRRDVIMALLCQGRVDFADIRARHGVDVPAAFADELLRLAPLAAEGLVDLRGDGIRVTPTGAYVVRAIAMVFDRYLRRGSVGERVFGTV